ncbi:M14 family zinc carboxypeptidase [Micromonospora sp. NPDC004704]
MWFTKSGRGVWRGAVSASAAACLAVTGFAAPASASSGTAPAGSPPSGQVTQLPSGNTTYRTLDDYERDMQTLVREHPKLVKPLTLPYPTSTGRLVRGIEISRDVRANDGKPVFVTVGMHHGNEWPSGELVMEYATDLVQRAARGDRYVSSLLNRARLVVVPIVNVDGFTRNRRQTDTNVDMNRNYGFGWLPISTGGAAPWSEPETRNIEWLLSTRQATTFVTQHTCIQVVLYPPLQLEVGPTQDVARFEDLATRMARRYGPNYIPRDSAHDYETTGEAIDWAYFATRGLAFTAETCPDSGVERTFQTQVVDAYAEHRLAMFEALEATADPDQHAVIEGRAPKGAVLRIAKSFNMYTQPYPQADGTTRPTAFGTTLTSDLNVSRSNGKFSWAVNPSYRPVPPYQANGVQPNQTGFYREPWILTCERPDGTVLQRTAVNVNLGQKVKVDLRQCERNFRKKSH